VKQQARRHRSTGSSGFTLIEALAAIVILALSFTTLLSAFRTGLQGADAVDDHLRARLLAQSLLAEWTQHRSLQPGQFHGRADRFTWTISIAPFDDGAARSRQQPDRWSLHKLTVAVAWPPRRRIEIDTLRLLQVK
jgi:general secretion pathway protein I